MEKQGGLRRALALAQRLRPAHMRELKRLARPVPPVPVPETVPHPQPRVVWSSERYRVVARDWADGHPATYSVLAQQRGRWQPATGEECWACLISLARWLDGQQQPR